MHACMQAFIYTKDAIDIHRKKCRGFKRNCHDLDIVLLAKGMHHILQAVKTLHKVAMFSPPEMVM